MILKHFLKQKGLNESYNGGLGSYALVIIVAGYLMVAFKHAKVDPFRRVFIQLNFIFGCV